MSGDTLNREEFIMIGKRNCSFFIFLINSANVIMSTVALNLWYFHSSEKRLQDNLMQVLLVGFQESDEYLAVKENAPS